jgi:protein TonB
MASCLKHATYYSSKSFIMNSSKLRSAVNGLVILFTLTTFVIACNNNKTESGTTDTSVSSTMPADTTQMNTPVDTSALTTTVPATTDTSANKPIAPTTAASKKKGKATVGTMPVVKNPKIKMDKSGVYEYSEVRPSYPGGQAAIETYITNHIQYPETALDYNKEGRIGVAFTVDENGKVTDTYVMGKKLGDGLDEEAIRVVSSMPNWKPGMVQGKPVKSKVTLPITFKIEEQ